MGQMSILSVNHNDSSLVCFYTHLYLICLIKWFSYNVHRFNTPAYAIIMFLTPQPGSTHCYFKFRTKELCKIIAMVFSFYSCVTNTVMYL